MSLPSVLRRSAARAGARLVGSNRVAMRLHVSLPALELAFDHDVTERPEETIARWGLRSKTICSGISIPAPLFYVSPTQVSYRMASGKAASAATITVLNNGSTAGQGTTLVESVTPGPVAGNSNGQGVVAALAMRVKSDGSQVAESVLQLNATTNLYEVLPLVVNSTDHLYLMAFGTGFASAPALQNRHRAASGATWRLSST